mgnify:CR=1 FL=1
MNWKFSLFCVYITVKHTIYLIFFIFSESMSSIYDGDLWSPLAKGWSRTVYNDVPIIEMVGEREEIVYIIELLVELKHFRTLTPHILELCLPLLMALSFYFKVCNLWEITVKNGCHKGKFWYFLIQNTHF